jgi:hypothetical protein
MPRTSAFFSSLILAAFAACLFSGCANLASTWSSLFGMESGSDASDGSPATVYVDSVSGDDSGDGLSASSPWKTLAKVEASVIPAGSSVLLKRGCAWREQLIPHSGRKGSVVTYGAYGSGDRPRVCASIDAAAASGWTEGSGGTWSHGCGFGRDVGNVIFVSISGTVACGVKKWSRSALSSEGDFYYDGTEDRLHIRLSANPGSLGYPAVELAVTAHIVDQANKAWISYSSLDLRYGGAHGIGGGNTRGVSVSDCEISWVGGGLLKGSTRYGNGIEFWGNAEDELVERCYVHDVYDSGLTNQASGAGSVQKRITYRNNIVRDCGMGSFEYWNRGSATSDIVFEHNSCLGAGSGWGSLQGRPDSNTAGFQVRLDYNPASSRALSIRNNIFLGSAKGLLQVSIPGTSVTGWNGWSELELDYNLWSQAQAEGAFIFFNAAMGYAKSYGLGDFTTYVSESGKDSHGLAADPGLVDPGSASPEGCKPKASSPAKAAGKGGVATDFGGNARSATAPTIGAWE